uniref:TUG ubiquitin-like domain-containing protein n=1 Tax=Periophthalmus magnuspinnatus TaxID=409849 RepID=A0A3B4ASQ2_9GOBI
MARPSGDGTAVTVLTPNGRRQTVKVSPNTPLLQVTCCQNDFKGFEKGCLGIRFQRTVLDLTLQWRFANLPNNAKLEMVPSTKKTTVRIALQMEDGSRLQDSFSSGQSLWELLTHFPQISRWRGSHLCTIWTVSYTIPTTRTSLMSSLKSRLMMFGNGLPSSRVRGKKNYKMS